MTGAGAAEVLAREAARPVRLVGMGRARHLWPALQDERVILHAGPPLDGADPTPAMRSAMIGALLFEGAARTPEQAEQLLESGAYEFVSCHTAGGVGAMAGVVTPSVPVLAVEREDGRRAYAPVNEGLGRALRFGDFDAGTLDRLRELASVVAPALDRAIRARPPIDVVALQADALRRGDEGHNRNVAATAQLTTALAPAIARANDTASAVAALQCLSDNPHFFLAVSMAAAKAVADALHELPEARGIVTAMASNGHGTGVRVGGVPGWLSAPAVPVDLITLDGAEIDDFAPAMGDSSVVEAIGLGAMALSASPALARTLGWNVERTRAHAREMEQICVARSLVYEVPDTDFAGAPLGISVQRVLESGIAPAFTTGFSHREPGRGRAGFGIVRPAMETFESAGRALGEHEEALR